MRADEETRKRLISLAGALADLFVVFILIVVLLYFVFFLFIGLDGVIDLKEFVSTLSELVISLFIIVAVVLVLFFLSLYIHWLFKKEEGTKILPFVVAVGEEKYSGNALSILLAAELLRICEIQRLNFEAVIPVGSENY